MLNKIQEQAKDKMQNTIEALQTELAKLRTGRAHPSLLEHIHVDYYGSSVPLSQVGNVSVENARMLTIAICFKYHDLAPLLIKSSKQTYMFNTTS